MLRSRELPFRLFVLATALLGLLVARHYGESWDELKFYKYADLSLGAYGTWLGEGRIAEFGNTYDNYGPAYVMLVTLGARALGPVLPWSHSDLRHLLYFATFLAGVWAFHALARRWLGQAAAFGAALLLATQPIFWGHAFISPKDIPFLALTLLALLAGLRAFDAQPAFSLKELPPRAGRALRIGFALWLLSLLAAFLGTAAVHAWIESAVRAAAAGGDNLIARLASDVRTAAPEVYVHRYFAFFLRARLAYALLSILAAGLLARRYAPAAYATTLRLLPAAALLGVATSVRVLGPLAGLLVALHALRAHGRSALPGLAAYAVVALAAMYATWPYLWPDPPGHLLESLRVMSQYPWQGEVLFDGVQYASTAIPRAYLPALLAIQLTEPVWPLFVAGLALALADYARRRERLELLALAALWFALPLAGFVLSRAPLYDNFRQVFFILPPVFLLAGVVFEKLRPRALQIALVALAALPGIAAGVRLHPYEYIYYNRFAGGQAGAFRRFEMDYWGTSYRQAADWLNEHAPEDAAVWADGPAHLLDLYLRPDLHLYSPYEAERADDYDYVVATSRYDLDLRTFPEAPVVHAIQRGGAILTVIKQP